MKYFEVYINYGVRNEYVGTYPTIEEALAKCVQFDEDETESGTGFIVPRH